ncbi:MAG: alanine racemase [Clostridia bacterium]|nr:alanine racemase [Clostridia bacterium]
MNYGRTWVQIDLGAICHNVACVRNKIGQDVKLLTVIKADAYGHGAVEVAKALQKQCDFFGVASVSEGVELRKAGIRIPILVLGFTDSYDFTHAVEFDIRPTIFTLEQAHALSEEAQRQGKTASFHFAVDTGMSRIGFQVTEECADIVEQITKLPSLHAEGIFSHYFASDEADLSRARAQQESFFRFNEMLSARGVEIPIRHMSNSAGILTLDKRFDMVRSGIITYGVFPSAEVDRSMDLRPAMQWKSQVFHVKTLESGRFVGYGGTYVTSRPTVVATIPVGYADGYPWCLSNKGKVIIRGKFAPIIGRVCMDLLMVDVTDIEGVRDGDIVTLIGSDGCASLSVEEVAEAAHSFSYELLCSFTRRVPRVYVRNDREIKVVDYLESE